MAKFFSARIGPGGACRQYDLAYWGWPVALLTGRLERRWEERATPPNKRMQLTKLRAAPVLRAEVPPCAPAGETDGGTASQLIRSVGPTRRGRERAMGCQDRSDGHNK